MGLIGDFGKVIGDDWVLSTVKAVGKVEDQHWLCSEVVEVHTADKDVAVVDIGSWG